MSHLASFTHLIIPHTSCKCVTTRRPSQNHRLAGPFPRPLRRSDSDPIAPLTPYDNGDGDGQKRDVIDIDDCIAEMLDCANELANLGVVSRRPQYLHLQHPKQQQQPSHLGLRNDADHPEGLLSHSTPSSSITATTPLGTATTINDSLLSDNSSFFGDAEMSSASSEASFGSGSPGKGLLTTWKKETSVRSSEEGSGGAESPFSHGSTSKRLIVNDDGYYTHISASGMSAVSSFSPAAPAEYDYPPILRQDRNPVLNIKKRISKLFLTERFDNNDNNNVYDLDTLPAEVIDGLRLCGQRKLQTYSANGSDEPADGKNAENRKNAVMKNVQKFLRSVRKAGSSSSAPTIAGPKKILQQFSDIQLIFGTSLCHIQVATCGNQVLPTCIMEVIRFLESTGSQCEGIFRRNGTDSGKRALLLKCERAAINAPVFVRDNELTLAQTHDACALLRQYLRELPDRIINDAACEHLFRIPRDVNGDALLEMIKYCVWLLPEEHIDVLRIILKMLNTIKENSKVNYMDAKNLAVCMVPSLFTLSTNRITVSSASKRRRTVGGSGLPDSRELAEYEIGQKVLMLMIDRYQEVFTISPQMASPSLKCLPDLEVGFDGDGKFHIGREALAHMDETVRPLFKDLERNWREWINEKEWCDVDLAWKDCPNRMRQWKGSIYIDAPAKCVYKKLASERSRFEPNVTTWKTVFSKDSKTELVHAVYRHPQNDCERHGLFLRQFRSCSYSKYPGTFFIAERSARADEFTEKMSGPRTPWINLYQSVFLIVHEGAGTRIYHISEVDFKGRSSQWYESRYAPHIVKRLHMIRDAFQASLFVDDLKNGSSYSRSLMS
ncbi:hypothetical protein L596_017205 [Steinernema carpocapsae]|uniref:Rho-GAP domain-containing protein n=1 Tax=Steinernema carpocapsae TaxID=34508 RepID=A0A4U5N1Q3_STECR|nr:hypothetical protein L596_017205 [Steinernema carpocapsae]